MNEFSLCSLTSYDIRTRSEDDLDRKLELRAKKDRAAFFCTARSHDANFYTVVQIRNTKNTVRQWLRL